MRRNHVRLITLFVWIVVLAAVVGLMWVRGWQPGTLLYNIVWDSAELFDVGVGRPIEVMMGVLFGIYFGTLALFTLDWRKRVQGLLLTLGTVTMLVVLWNSDMLLVHFEATPVNGVAFVVGTAMIGYLERDELFTLLEARSVDELEFDRTLTLLFGIIAVVVVGAWIQVFLVGELRFLIDTIATGVLLYLLVGFFSYNSNATTAIVGPRGSGKTTTILGLYRAFNERRENISEPTTTLDDLQSQVEDMSQGDDWPFENTSTFEEVGFYHVLGGLFPRRYRISARDHPGETLGELAKHLDEDLTMRDRIRNFYNDLQTLLLPGYSRSEEERFYYETRNADLIVLLIDTERVLTSGKGTEVPKLRRVGRRVRENGGEVIVAATKVDTILDEMLSVSVSSHGGTQELASARTVKEMLNDYLQQRTQISDMLSDVECDEIYPLYYEHEETELGSPVPKLDEHGDIQGEGHEELAEGIEQVLRDV